MSLRAAYTERRRSIGCLLFIGHLPQQSPRISGPFAKNNLQLRHPMGFRHPVLSIALRDVSKCGVNPLPHYKMSECVAYTLYRTAECQHLWYIPFIALQSVSTCGVHSVSHCRTSECVVYTLCRTTKCQYVWRILCIALQIVSMCGVYSLSHYRRSVCVAWGGYDE